MRRAAAVVLVAAVVVSGCSGKRKADLVVGKLKGTTTTPVTAAPVTVPPPNLGRAPLPEPRPARGLTGANGRPYGTIAFSSDTPVPGHLLFILVAGSDARPGEDLRRTRSDSIHLLAVNPRTLEGTVMGFPRDSWVDIPGHGAGKINTALQLGGPDLLAQTVRHLTGLPVHYYVLTSFPGLTSMVDELGGVDVFVDRRMNDSYSGARFEPGWHHFNGSEALAFSRDRHDVPNGDFSRSENQGKLILAALAKMRGEVGDDEGIRQWIRVMLRHVVLDVSADEVLPLGALARRLEPASLRNIVVPGRVGTAGKQSVVYLGEEATRIFEDLRPDAVLGSPQHAEQTTTSPTSSTAPSTTTTTDGGLLN
ncbi:MAG: polyisoprenyl-teichoic acid--peptidoglycan teichoic acid transferase [Actinomycetota bacterium]|nr:polyisoprenyl-teichoic acid--peptidoglycan teichoic acid transferase [Actinomycetota bacterium]